MGELDCGGIRCNRSKKVFSDDVVFRKEQILSNWVENYDLSKEVEDWFGKYVDLQFVKIVLKEIDYGDEFPSLKKSKERVVLVKAWSCTNE